MEKPWAVETNDKRMSEREREKNKSRSTKRADGDNVFSSVHSFTSVVNCIHRTLKILAKKLFENQ